MKEASLGRLLSGAEAAALVRGILTATGAASTVWDVHGGRLLAVSEGPCDETQQKHAVLCEGEVVGWVSGGEQAEPMAALLSFLVTQESDQEELLDEILDLYRQVNLLFGLSEKLHASLEPEVVAGTILREASRLIEATGGTVVLLDKERIHRTLATMGQGIPSECHPALLCGERSTALVGTTAEIINDVRQDPRYAGGMESIRSLICAPLMLEDESFGAVILASQAPVTYTAADLKLLSSLATLAAPAIEHALLYERTEQEHKETEESLRQLVEDLRNALDEARQKEKVAEITGSEYYQMLRNRADALRSIMRDPRAE
jgi:transcriptional regulator with GAF, ATPase, and Fis domain